LESMTSFSSYTHGVHGAPSIGPQMTNYGTNRLEAERQKIQYEKNHSPMGHYVSTYYKSTYQKDYNSSESHQSYSPGERNPFYTTVTGRTPTPDNFHF